MTEYIFTSNEMSTADKLTIKNGISSQSLMYKAGEAVLKNLPTDHNGKVLVICGPGNNGGDGYVVAGLLSSLGVSVEVMSLEFGKIPSIDNQFYKNKLDDLLFKKNLNDLSNYEYVVDALFGIGLSRKLPDKIIDLINNINSSDLDVYSIDVPTGINSDTGEIHGIAFKCRKTITFFNKKLCHYLLPGRHYCGEIVVEDIGISKEVIKKIMP